MDGGDGRSVPRRGGAHAASWLVVAALAGCGSVPPASPGLQTLRVETPGCDRALCVLSNDRGRWSVDPTPGDVEVRTSARPLEVACRAHDQSSGASMPALPPGPDPTAGAAGAVVGAAALGAAAAPLLATPLAPLVGVFAVYGAVAGAGAGRALDAASRAWVYPSNVVVAMRCDPVGVDPAALASAPLGIVVRAAAPGEPAAAVVATLADAGRAARAGLRVGDAIVGADGADVDGPASLEERVRAAPPERPLRLAVRRDGRMLDIVVEPRR